MSSTQDIALTTERRSTHGDWLEQAEYSVTLKLRFRSSRNWSSLAPYQQEALDLIAMKVSRILTGDPDFADHWDDIAGYAHLGKGGHS